MLLRDNRGRDLRIFVVRDVAYAISLRRSPESPDRPYTHDLMRTMLERFGGKVDRIIIDDLWQDTFYAKIYLQSGTAPKRSWRSIRAPATPSPWRCASALRSM